MRNSVAKCIVSWILRLIETIIRCSNMTILCHGAAYLAHNKASPGTLSICRTALFFTPVTASRPKIRIALDDVRGVKKIGPNAIPGLSVKWQRSSGSTSFNETEAEVFGGTAIVEEKFRWIGVRDEGFARLVGWGGRKWLKV